MITLAVLGAAGRMGTRVLECAAADEHVRVVAALVRPQDPRLGERRRVGHEVIALSDQTDAPFDVLIDFSTPAATLHWLDISLARRCALVVGTTGHSAEGIARIAAAARTIPILKAANFSVGINLLLGHVGRLAVELGDEYDIEIVESHHRHKVDAPSGTALALVKAIVDATGRDAKRDVALGRSGSTESRPKRQIGVHAVRLGDDPGGHSVHFGGDGERITLTHQATSRDTFAYGALRAAKWLVRRPASLYSMADCLRADNLAEARPAIFKRGLDSANLLL
jgi:4-hydroxy-tetrahydrodipicolinate reductase